MTKHSAWRPPAKRHKRRLGACEITLHALDSYLTRWPGATVHTAREALGKAAAKATFVRRGARGEEIWEHEGLRLVVHRIARRPPIVLSVLVERGET